MSALLVELDAEIGRTEKRLDVLYRLRAEVSDVPPVRPPALAPVTLAQASAIASRVFAEGGGLSERPHPMMKGFTAAPPVPARPPTPTAQEAVAGAVTLAADAVQNDARPSGDPSVRRAPLEAHQLTCEAPARLPGSKRCKCGQIDPTKFSPSQMSVCRACVNSRRRGKQLPRTPVIRDTVLGAEERLGHPAAEREPVDREPVDREHEEEPEAREPVPRPTLQSGTARKELLRARHSARPGRGEWDASLPREPEEE